MKVNDEKLLATYQSHQPNSVIAWNYVTGNQTHVFKNGGIATANTLRLISNDYVLTADRDAPLLHIWPINSPEQVKNIRFILPDKVNCLDVDPSNTFLVAGIGLSLYLWHLNSGRLFNVFRRHFQATTCVKFSSDSSYIVAGGEDGILTTYKLEDLSCPLEKSAGECEPIYQKMDHLALISAIWLGNFGRKSRIVTVSADFSCRIYALETGELFLTLAFSNLPTCVIMDKTGWNLYVGIDNGAIKKIHTRNPPRTLQYHVPELATDDYISHQKKVTCLNLNFDDTVLASGSEDNTIIVWDVYTKNVLRIVTCTGIVTNVLFVMNHTNFEIETLKTDIVLKPLQKHVDTNRNTFLVSAKSNQIVFDDDSGEDNGDDGNDMGSAQTQINNLKIINKQLYDYLIQVASREK